MQTKHSTNPMFSAIETLRDNWGWFLALGIFLIILGFLAIGSAVYTTFFTIFFLGILLVASGIAKLIYSFWAQNWSGFFISLLVGLLYGIVGVLFLSKPVPAAASLTLLIGSLFVVSGLFKIFASAILRFEEWGWIFVSGILSLILGALVLAEWPQSSLWLIGLFVGIDLIFYGWTWVILSLAGRRAEQRRLDRK